MTSCQEYFRFLKIFQTYKFGTLDLLILKGFLVLFPSVFLSKQFEYSMNLFVLILATESIQGFTKC